jgi:hypothetical protein
MNGKQRVRFIASSIYFLPASQNAIPQRKIAHTWTKRRLVFTVVLGPGGFKKKLYPT